MASTRGACWTPGHWPSAPWCPSSHCTASPGQSGPGPRSTASSAEGQAHIQGGWAWTWVTPPFLAGAAIGQVAARSRVAQAGRTAEGLYSATSGRHELVLSPSQPGRLVWRDYRHWLAGVTRRPREWAAPSLAVEEVPDRDGSREPDPDGVQGRPGPVRERDPGGERSGRRHRHELRGHHGGHAGGPADVGHPGRADLR